MSSTRARTIFSFGIFQVDIETRELFRQGIRVRIQEQPFRILLALIETPGNIVTREELQRKIWTDETCVGFDDGLNAAVNKLRLALGDSAENPRFIETIPRRGYRFISSLKSHAVESDEAHVENESGRISATATSPTSLPMAATNIEGFPWVPRRNIHFVIAALMVLIAVCLAALARHSPAQGPRTVSTPDSATLQMYAQGRALWRKRGEKSLKEAIETFNRTIQHDPDFAPAYSGLADCYVALPFFTNISPKEAYAKSSAAAKKAVELDAGSAEAHTSLADSKLYADWDFAGAEAEFKKALSLNPDYMTAHQWYAEFLSLLGRHQEALRQILIAERLDPNSAVVHHQAGQVLQEARRYDDAIAEYGKAIALDPELVTAYDFTGIAYRRKGMYREAFAWKELGASKSGDPTFLAMQKELARTFFLQGEQAWLRESIRIGETSPASDPYLLASRYAELGQNDQAFKYLWELYDQHSPDLLNIQNEPELDPIRQDPRFGALLSQVGMPTIKFELR